MAGKANIEVDQGADFSTTITVRDTNNVLKDLTNHTGYGQIRKHYTSTTAINITIIFDNPRSAGQVTLSLSRAQTAAMEAGRYVYDVEITDEDNFRTRLVEGILTVLPQVTKISLDDSV